MGTGASLLQLFAVNICAHKTADFARAIFIMQQYINFWQQKSMHSST